MHEHFVLYQYPATKYVLVQKKTEYIEGEDCGNNKSLRGSGGTKTINMSPVNGYNI